MRSFSLVLVPWHSSKYSRCRPQPGIRSPRTPACTAGLDDFWESLDPAGAGRPSVAALESYLDSAGIRYFVPAYHVPLTGW